MVGNATLVGLSGAIGAGASWILSSSMTPLLGGVVSAVASLVSLFVLALIGRTDPDCRGSQAILGAVELSSAIGVSSVATALGYPVSMMMAFLITAANVAAVFVTVSMCAKK